MINKFKYRDYTTAALLVLDSGLDYHDLELETEICYRAGLEEEFASAGDDFEVIIDRAIEILKEDI